MNSHKYLSTLWISLLLCMVSFTSAQADSTDSDKAQILQLIKNYTKGTYEGDRALLTGCFHKNAIMNGYLMGNLIMATPQLFIDDMEKNPVKNSGSEYKHELKHLSIQGKTASLIVEESGFPGDARFTNYFHLIDDGSGWKIISKMFSNH